MLGAESNCQEIPRKRHGTKGSEKHTNYSPVRNISVSGLRLISRSRELKWKTNHKQKSRSLLSAKFPNPQQCAQGTKMKSKKEYSVSYSGEKIRNLWGSVIGLIDLEVHRCIWHTHSCRKTRMELHPQVNQPWWRHRKPEKSEYGSWTWANWWLVYALFTTD